MSTQKLIDVAGGQYIPAIVMSDKPFLDPTGLALGGKILSEDNFKSGMDGWVQLYTPSQNGLHKLGTLSRIFRGAPRIQIRTPNVMGIDAMGIKRMGNYYGEGRYLVEFLASIDEVSLDTNRPRYYSWGIDVANSAGERRFFALRYTRFDEGTVTEVKKWSLVNSGGLYDLPSATGLMFPANENKALPVYLALVVNTITGKYEGVRIGDSLKFGSLATTPDTTLTAQNGPTMESLVTFAGGLNPFFQVLNRSNNSSTAAASALQWQRTTYLGV